MIRNEEENLTNRPITEFISGEDTIYISKMRGGFQIVHYCKFVSYERGVVTGDVISWDPDWAYNEWDLECGIEVRARLSKCYLFGREPEDEVAWPMCHWFDDKTKKVKGA